MTRMALNILGIKVVPLETLPETGFIPSVERCRNLITSKTKAVVLVTPNNPVRPYFGNSRNRTMRFIDRSNLLAITNLSIRRAGSGEKPSSHSR